MKYTDAQLEKIKELKPYDVEESFVDLLNCDGPAKIGGYEYCQAEALKAVDPIAYRCGLSDYIDSLQSEGALSDEIEGEYYSLEDVEAALEEVEEEEGVE